MQLLLDLPLDFTVDLLSTWLSLQGLAGLDAAQCGRSTRAAFLEILRADGFLLDLPKYGCAKEAIMQWVMVRKIKIRRVRIGFPGLAPPTQARFKSFLSCTGSNVLEIMASNSAYSLDHVCKLAITKCLHLRNLFLWECGKAQQVTICQLIARKTQTLQRLVLGESFVNSALPTKNCEMIKLQYLTFHNSYVNTANLCAFVSHCANLLYFSYNHFHDADPCLHALAQSCPSLVALHYGYHNMAYEAHKSGTAGLEAVLQACKELHTVDFMSCLGFTNAHVAAVALRCKHLKAIQLTFYDEGLRGDCLDIIAPRLSELRHLSLISLHPTSDAALLLLTQRCTQLRSLGLRYLCDVGSAEPLITLFRTLPFLEDLDLTRVEVVTDAVLATIATCQPRLRKLSLFCAWGFTEKGLMALANNCAALEWIRVSVGDSGDSPISKTLRRVWKLLRPNLTFVDEYYRWTRWDDLRQDV